MTKWYISTISKKAIKISNLFWNTKSLRSTCFLRANLLQVLHSFKDFGKSPGKSSWQRPFSNFPDPQTITLLQRTSNRGVFRIAILKNMFQRFWRINVINVVWNSFLCYQWRSIEERSEGVSCPFLIPGTQPRLLFCLGGWLESERNSEVYMRMSSFLLNCQRTDWSFFTKEFCSYC